VRGSGAVTTERLPFNFSMRIRLPFYFVSNEKMPLMVDIVPPNGAAVLRPDKGIYPRL
jgi:hypothetical protein